MDGLEKILMTFENWSSPWEFYNFVFNNQQLSQKERDVFKDLWHKAGDFEIWNNADLNFAAKTCNAYIQNHYNFSEAAIAQITRALSYNWR